jgi:hypothetical protein
VLDLIQFRYRSNTGGYCLPEAFKTTSRGENELTDNAFHSQDHTFIKKFGIECLSDKFAKHAQIWAAIPNHTVRFPQPSPKGKCAEVVRASALVGYA